MAIEPVYVGGPPERKVGQVYADIRVANGRDRILVEEGVLPPDAARFVELATVLVDTGATTLCLPTSVVEELGLRPSREVDVETAAGRRRTRVFDGVLLRIEDREGAVPCLEMPGGGSPLLGVIPLGWLGFEPDLKNRRLRKLPMDDSGSFLTIY